MLKLTMNRDDAWTLLTEYTKGESLLKHALGVEAAVRGYARLFGEDEEAWGITALLHDFDYERWPTLGDHPNKGAEILREGLPGMDDPGDSVARDGDHRRDARQHAGKDVVRLRRARRVHHRRVARASQQEHHGPRAEVGDEADEGQGVRQRREARGSARGRRDARPHARGAHRQRDRVHAGTSRRARTPRNAMMHPSVYLK